MYYMDADEHYRKHFELCVCEQSCSFSESMKLDRSFRKLSEVVQLNNVRWMLLALAAAANEENDFL